MCSNLLTVLGILLVAALLSVRSFPVGDADDKTSTTTPTDSTPLSIKSSTPVPGQSNPQKSGSEVLKSADDRTRRDISPSTTPFPSQSYLPISECEETDYTSGKVRRDTPSSTTVTPSQSTTASSIPLKSGSDVLTPVRTGRETQTTSTTPNPFQNQGNPLKSGADVLTPVTSIPSRIRRATQSSSTPTPNQSSSKNTSPIKVRRDTQTTSTTPNPSQNQGNPLKSGADVITPVTSIPSRIRRDTTSTTSAKPTANVASQKFGAERPKVSREVTTAKPTK